MEEKGETAESDEGAHSNDTDRYQIGRRSEGSEYSMLGDPQYLTIARGVDEIQTERGGLTFLDL